MLDFQIPEPVLFNPLKHHLGFIKEVISGSEPETEIVLKKLKHLGTSVMDVYTGVLTVPGICSEITAFLRQNDLGDVCRFSSWAGPGSKEFRVTTLTDGSQWVLKYYRNEFRYVHIFPARNSQFTFRTKSNTIKSALLYLIISGKDLISAEELNQARMKMNLSPVKDPVEAEAITELIELLRS